MKMLIVHDGDSDGRTAACLFLQSILLLKLSVDPLMPEFKNNLESLGARATDTTRIQLYETRSRDTIEWLKYVNKDTIVVILDLTFRLEHFQEILAKTKSVYVMDHHDGYDFAWMDASCLRGFGKCWLPSKEGHLPIRGTTHLNDHFNLHYATNKSTTGLAFSLYQHVLSNAAFNMEVVKRNQERMNFRVFMHGRKESHVDIVMEPPNPENFYFDPTWVPNTEFVYNVEDFDINLRKLPQSANFDAGLRRIVDDTNANNMWAVYHMLFRNNSMEAGTSFMEGGNLVATPGSYLQVNSIAKVGEVDLMEYTESLKTQIYAGPKFIQMSRKDDEPNMHSFVMIECNRYQTQIGAIALEANPGFAFAILHYEEDGFEKLSLRRNFSPKFNNVNLKLMAEQLGEMICGESRGGGHPGASGLRLSKTEYAKLLEFIQRTCQKVTA